MAGGPYIGEREGNYTSGKLFATDLLNYGTVTPELIERHGEEVVSVWNTFKATGLYSDIIHPTAGNPSADAQFRLSVIDKMVNESFNYGSRETEFKTPMDLYTLGDLIRNEIPLTPERRDKWDQNLALRSPTNHISIYATRFGTEKRRGHPLSTRDGSNINRFDIGHQRISPNGEEVYLSDTKLIRGFDAINRELISLKGVDADTATDIIARTLYLIGRVSYEEHIQIDEIKNIVGRPEKEKLLREAIRRVFPERQGANVIENAAQIATAEMKRRREEVRRFGAIEKKEYTRGSMTVAGATTSGPDSNKYKGSNRDAIEIKGFQGENKLTGFDIIAVAADGVGEEGGEAARLFATDFPAILENEARLKPHSERGVLIVDAMLRFNQLLYQRYEGRSKTIGAICLCNSSTGETFRGGIGDGFVPGRQQDQFVDSNKKLLYVQNPNNIPHALGTKDLAANSRFITTSTQSEMLRPGSYTFFGSDGVFGPTELYLKDYDRFGHLNEQNWLYDDNIKRLDAIIAQNKGSRDFEQKFTEYIASLGLTDPTIIQNLKSTLQDSLQKDSNNVTPDLLVRIPIILGVNDNVSAIMINFRK